MFDSEESDEEPFNTTIETTSDDSAITMGKPVTTAFISDLVQILTEQVGCLQVTSQLQEFLDQYPPKSTEKAFELICQILQVLDKYLVDNLKQHQHCMSPDSEYITLIVYTTTLEIDLCNFPAIWAVLSILLDTMSSDLQYVQCLQQVFSHYYDTHTQDAMMKLEQQAIKIQNTIKAQDKVMKVQGKKDTPKVHMSDDNGQNKREIYRRAEYTIPQLDGTHNASYSSDIDSHDYLDLANIDNIQHNTRGQKKRQKTAEAEIANIHLAGIEIIKPNTRGRKQRQKVPDDEVIDMDKIAKDDTPRYTIKQELKDVLHARKLATEIKRQLKENRKLQAEKA